MKWEIAEGDNKKQVQSIEDIVFAVKNVMDGKCEFIIFSPSEPVNKCNCMQAISEGKDELYFEINMEIPHGNDSWTVYSKHISVYDAINVLARLYLEGVIPDLNEWLLGSDLY